MISAQIRSTHHASSSGSQTHSSDRATQISRHHYEAHHLRRSHLRPVARLDEDKGHRLRESRERHSVGLDSDDSLRSNTLRAHMRRPNRAFCLREPLRRSPRPSAGHPSHPGFGSSRNRSARCCALIPGAPRRFKHLVADGRIDADRSARAARAIPCRLDCVALRQATLRDVHRESDAPAAQAARTGRFKIADSRSVFR